jgi:hypothetical protein
MTSYFEIDGEIIAVDTIGDPLDVSETPQSTLEAAMRLHEREQIAAELTGDPNSLYYEDADLADVLETGFTPAEVGQSLGRLRRATTAATWAGTLALADGPLPFGDALAAGVLAGYAVYELSLIYRDYRD